MDIFELSDFEFEELEDFDEWSKYEVIQCDSVEKVDRAQPRSSSFREESADGVNDMNSLGQKRKQRVSMEDLSPEQLDQLRQRYKLCKPRIVKSDFRRKFPAHWVNVFNTGSYDYLMSHINNFYVPDVMLQQRDLRPLERINTSAENVKTSDLRGASVVSEFWYKAMHIAPDVVCTLKHSFVKVRSDGTSTIRCSIVLNGTKIVQLTNSKDLQHIQAYAQTAGTPSKRAQFVQEEAGAGDISATVAAMAAVAPDKIRTVLSARRPTRTVLSIPQAHEVQGLIMTSATDVAGDVKATVINDRATWAAATVLHTSARGPLEEMAGMDHTDAAARYLEATAAVQQCTKRKRSSRNKSFKRKNSAEWFTLARDAFGSQLDNPFSSETVSAPKYNIPYTRLATLCNREKHTHSLRAENNNRQDTGLTYTAHPMSQAAPCAQQQVVLTAQLDFLCSIELNFNADDKVESVILNYIT